MNREEIYRQFEELDKRASLGGGVDKIEKQHASGRMTARERIDMLLDKGSFNELDKFVNHRCTNFGMEKKQIAGDGMVSGYGKIDGRLVFCLCLRLHGARRFAQRDECRKDCEGAAACPEERRSRHCPQRFGRRAHSGRCEQLGRLCLHLLSKHHCVGCHPADICHSGAVCRWGMLLSGAYRLYLHGKGAEPHVHHRSGRGKDRDPRGGGQGGTGRCLYA